MNPTVQWFLTYGAIIAFLMVVPFVWKWILNLIKPEEDDDSEILDLDIRRSGEALTEEQETSSGEIYMKLLDLGYFDYLDSTRKDSVGREISRDLAQGYFETQKDTLSEVPYCKRLWDCNAFALANTYGTEEMMNVLRPYFEVAKIPVHSLEYDNSFEDDLLNVETHWNGKIYLHLQGHEPNEESPALVVESFVKMLNEQLELAGCPDRCYPVGGGEDGRLVFLTEEQFRYIVPLIPHEVERPCDDWDDFWNIWFG